MWNGQGRRVSNPTIEGKNALKNGREITIDPPKS